VGSRSKVRRNTCSSGWSTERPSKIRKRLLLVTRLRRQVGLSSASIRSVGHRQVLVVSLSMCALIISAKGF
jgi:hypothetical protein